MSLDPPSHTYTSHIHVTPLLKIAMGLQLIVTQATSLSGRLTLPSVKGILHLEDKDKEFQ